MSADARDWAFSQDIKPSSVKFVLVTLADMAQSDEAYAAIATVAEKTGQDRKTVIAALKKLEEMGHIADTGKRIGRTGQIPVYKLNLTGVKSTENGTVKPEETVPFFPDNSTVFPSKSTVFPSNSTENGTRNHKEPLLTVIEPKKDIGAKKEKKEAFVLPDWIPLDAWNGYLDMRKKKKKPPTDYARDLLIKELEKLQNEGHDLTKVLNNSIKNDWTDLYGNKNTLKTSVQGIKGQPQPDNFAAINYGTAGKL